MLDTEAMQKPPGFRRCLGCGIVMPISDSHSPCLISLGEELGREECSTPNSWGVLGGIHPCGDWRSFTCWSGPFRINISPRLGTFPPLSDFLCKSDKKSGRLSEGGEIPPYVKLSSETSRSDSFGFEAQEFLLEPKNWCWELLSQIYYLVRTCSEENLGSLLFRCIQKVT